MHTGRIAHSLASIGQFIYAVGGVGDGQVELDSCERYDTMNN